MSSAGGIGTSPPAIASSVKMWNGSAWVTNPFSLRVPGLYFGATWVERLRATKALERYEGSEGAATWTAGWSFASGQPLIVSGGAVYQDGEGFLGDPVLSLKYLPGDLRQDIRLGPGTYRQRARIIATKRTAGPNTATLTWRAYSGQTDWTSGPWSASQAWAIYTSPSFTIPSGSSEVWNPYFRLDQGILGDYAIWRLGVNYVELLNGSSQPLHVWTPSNFLVRTATGWLRA